MHKLGSILWRWSAHNGGAKARNYSSAARESMIVWKMPWQQCSVFSSNSRLNDQGEYTCKNGIDPTGSIGKEECLNKHKSQSQQQQKCLHDLLLTEEEKEKKKLLLSKWNAPAYVKAIQNAAYWKNRNIEGMDYIQDNINRLIKAIALNVNGMNNYELTRVIYACAKGGFLESKTVSQSFITLMEDEVMQRMDTLQAVDLFRILHSITHINAQATMYPVTRPLYNGEVKERTPFDESVVKRIIDRIVHRIANLGAMDIANLICLIAYHGMVDDKVIKGVNNAIKRRLWGIKEPISILTPLVALAMFDAVKGDTVNNALKALSSVSTPPRYGDGTIMNVHAVNQQLYPLKLLEVILRMDYEEIYDEIAPENKAYLDRIKRIMPRLHRCYDWEFVPPPPPPQKNALQSDIMQTQGHSINLVPHIHGPYVLRRCDPVRKLIVEGKNEWDNMQTWQRFYVHKYYQMRNRHLEKDGFKLLNTVQ